MNWINLSDAENKLKENNFEDKEALKYLIALIIITSLASTKVVEIEWLKNIYILFQIIISIWGTNKVFKLNKKGDGNNFFKRYLVLSWIIGFRLLLISLFIILPFSLLNHIFFSHLQIINIQIKDIFYTVFGLLFSIIYYFQFFKSIKRVSFK